MRYKKVSPHKSSWNDDCLKRVCDFANAQGGKIDIGGSLTHLSVLPSYSSCAYMSHDIFPTVDSPIHLHR